MTQAPLTAALHGSPCRKEMELISVTDADKMDKTGPVGKEDDIMFKFVDEEASFPIIMQNLTDPIPKVAQ